MGKAAAIATPCRPVGKPPVTHTISMMSRKEPGGSSNLEPYHWFFMWGAP